MTYLRAETSNINAWETLGNDGWNWETLWPYYKKYEEFQDPPDWQIADGIAYNPAYHGTDGLVKVGWVNGLINDTIFETWNDTHAEFGIQYKPDLNGGDMVGFSWHPRYVDRELNIRVDAGNAFYWPFANRTNLYMFSNTHADKIVWNSTEGTVVAGGVDVTAADGTTSTIYANKEVILSAGALRSPVILELSGIGNPE